MFFSVFYYFCFMKDMSQYIDADDEKTSENSLLEKF